MKLVIVSGLSGSGRSIALNTLEDSGYYCIDNLPFFLLEYFLDETCRQQNTYQKVAIGIDSRNQVDFVRKFPALLEYIVSLEIDCNTLFLKANLDTLINRFHETRRKHPLSSDTVTLRDAIDKEQLLMEPVADYADIVIDTTYMNVHQIRQVLRDRIEKGVPHACAIKLESFGYKYGLPPDSDFVFDARCLPNPYWQAGLQEQTGMDTGVVAFLNASAHVQEFVNDIHHFLQRWLPVFEKEHRNYLNVAVGCTGGQHRSVYIIEKIAALLQKDTHDVIVRHREISKSLQ